MTLRSLIVHAVSLTALAAPAAAQDLFDRGVFVITRDGAEIGREEFALRPGTGRGAAGLLAVSTTHIGGREIQRAVEVTRDYVPVSFQHTETAGGRVVARVTAQLAGIRFSVRITSQDGETVREFPVRPPAIILPDDAYAAFYFVPRPDTGTRPVAIVDPVAARSTAASAEALGQDTVQIADQRIIARHYRLRIGGAERHYWFTPSGDLLQVSEPGRSIVATRAELPRH